MLFSFVLIFFCIYIGKRGNFRKQGSNVDSLGFPYDYKSVMHYWSKSFGKWAFFKSRTIETVDKKYQNVIGQRRGFSEIDIKQINKIYGCSGGKIGYCYFLKLVRRILLLLV